MAVIFFKMKAKNLIKVFTTSVLLIILAIFVTAANAETIEISGNGSGSNNSIQLNQNNSININQSNSADVSKSVNINSNTGGIPLMAALEMAVLRLET